MTLDPFYLIVDSADWIDRLVPLGVKLVQLRIKERPVAELRSHIRRARATCAAQHCQLIVNDHWKIALDEGCDFVHLGQEDLASCDRPILKRSGVKLGLSTHDENELAIALAADPDYVALGPIWPTVLKAMRWEPQGLDRLRLWKEKVGALPLVGIGGITADRLTDVFEHGADSAAVVTDITRNPDPEVRTREWLARTAIRRARS